MRGFLSVLALLVLSNVCCGQEVVVTNRITIVPAQQEAEEMARHGRLRHCGRAGGRMEGIGFSTQGPDAACRACCFYKEAMRGRYRIVERGVAWSPVKRGWFAVIRYE
jgi:hypothetical protein